MAAVSYYGTDRSYGLVGGFPKHVPMGLGLDGQHLGAKPGDVTPSGNWIDDLMRPDDGCTELPISPPGVMRE